jgi:site-specific DNA recombinase
MKKAIIYARVSTDKQEEQRTIESQVAELREVCRKSGVDVVSEYTDDGYSGTTLVRPGLDRLRDDASKGLFQAVYILSPDRLARKYVFQALVIEELRKQGIEVAFLDKPVTDKPEDQLLLGIQGLISEYERAQILERTRRGKLHRARLGEIMGGSGPYGYDYVPKTRTRPAYWKVNEAEAEVVRLIFSRCLQQVNPHRITEELNQRGIKTRRGSKYWRQTVVQRILTNECYIGHAFYNKYRKGKDVYQRRDRSEWVPMKVPRIVDDATFRLVQELLSWRDRGGHGNRPGRVFLLSGLLRCHYCGSLYHGFSSNSNRNSYYRCSNFALKYPEPRTCWARAIRADRAEEAVVKSVENAILRPEILKKHLAAMTVKMQARGKLWEVTRQNLLKKQQLLDEKKKRLIELYLEGIVPRPEYDERRRELENEVRTLKLRLQERVQGQPSLDEEALLQRLDEFCQFARQRMEGLSPGEMKQFLRLLFDGAIFDWQSGTVKLRGHIPVPDKRETSYRFTPAKAGVIWYVKAPKSLSFEVEAKL